MNVTVEIERRNSDPAKPEWECLKCHAHAKIADVRDNLMVCPSCGSPRAHQRPRAHPPARRRRLVSRAVGQHPHARSARLLGPRDLPRARARGAGQDRAQRSDRDWSREHRWDAVRTRRDGLRLHGRQHGQRCRREAVAHRRAGRRRGPASGGSVQLRRRAHAGGHPQPHANGQDQLRRGPDQRSHGAVRGGARRPVYRRRRRELRVAGRHLHRRARRAALLHRAARDRRDDARGAPQGLRQRRAQPRTGPSRRRGRTQGPARQGRQLPATSGRG